MTEHEKAVAVVKWYRGINDRREKSEEVDALTYALKVLEAYPELLEALKALMARLDDHFGGDPRNDWREQEAARAAIQKAEGSEG